MKSAVAIGNFDGVHRGHGLLLAEARRLAELDGITSAALTFEPHPGEVLGRAGPPRLTGAERKRVLLAGAVDRVHVEPFTLDLSRESAEDFAKRLLAGELSAAHVVVGEDFHFGHKRSGDVALLRELGKTLGYAVHPIGLQHDTQGVISSTRIRQALIRGDVAGAARLLGRWHTVVGEIVHGNKLGRTLGFPTANLMHSTEMFPARGIYAVLVFREVGEGRLEPLARGVASLGTRPTIDATATQECLETVLFDFTGDLYGQTLGIAFVERLREELRFDSLDAMVAQMHQDADTARELLGAVPFDGPAA